MRDWTFGSWTLQEKKERVKHPTTSRLPSEKATQWLEFFSPKIWQVFLMYAGFVCVLFLPGCWWLCVNEIARKSCRPLADPAWQPADWVVWTFYLYGCAISNRIQLWWRRSPILSRLTFVLRAGKLTALVWVPLGSFERWRGATMNKCLSLFFAAKVLILEMNRLTLQSAG